MISWEATVLVAITCVLVESFFSGSEIALVSANRVLLRQKATAGNRAAALAERLLERPQILLATTLVGTNAATVTFSVVVTLTLIGHATPNSELLAVLLVTPCTLLLGEVVPKTFYQRRADALVTRIVYPLHIVSFVVRPVVWVMGAFAATVTKLLNVESARAFITRDELALLLEVEADSPRSSEVSKEEMAMISNVLEAWDRPVVEVMLPLSEVVALPEDATLAEAALEVADKQHTRIPVYRGRVDAIVGVLHAFDLLRRDAARKADPVAEIARTPIFAPEFRLAGDLLAELQRTGNQMAVVVDEYGGATGIVTIEDILEEIVGEIEDEYDAEPPIRREGRNVWWVEARTPVERINEELGLGLPEADEEYESVAGLLLARMKRIPHTGEVLRFGNVTITVSAASDRAIEAVRIRLG